ncbi:hypothetical protein [Paraflavitalea pollutisoli]|uniref:hypothetical protein n=1 Tax=Paraflavitalea pollutisoli TaxID=3034143 RepID=UPI0023EBB653|nr:hypothetical protein [Paraflavitalea sp. H1-2-19X]
MKSYYLLILMAIIAGSCKDKDGNIEMEAIVAGQQIPIYAKLTTLFGSIPSNDSLSVLILPIDITCPSCRKKILVGFMKHKDHLKTNHYIIIAGNGGKKHIDGYFQEHKLRLPTGIKRLALDTIGLMKNNALFDDEPVIYYGTNQKITAKSRVYPDNVKQQLQSFF